MKYNYFFFFGKKKSYLCWQLKFYWDKFSNSSYWHDLIIIFLYLLHFYLIASKNLFALWIESEIKITT